jgi:NADH-quinone oxidoreductase subunit J
MFAVLFMQLEPGEKTSFQEFGWTLLPVLLAFIAVYLLLPKARRAPELWGILLGGAALVTGCLFLLHAAAVWQETLLFYIFAFLAVLAGGLMVTQSNPVYAALSFALVVLSTCGLFLIQAAPFLMAATIIIYAGAIVVTFLFVIMLAQQEGYSSADLLSREPFLGAMAGFVLMGATFCTLQRALATPELDRIIEQLHKLAGAQTSDEVNRVLGTPPEKAVPGQRTLRLIDEAARCFDPTDPAADHLVGIEMAWNERKPDKLKDHVAPVLARLEQLRRERGTLTGGTLPAGQSRIPGHAELQPGVLPQRNVEGLGRLLFTTYLVPVELAGVLLLVASIGAIVIAGRHSEVLR